jgi:hypothetical protein
MLGFSIEHRVIPILVKESPEAFIDAPFLGLGVASFLAQLHILGGFNLVVVHHSWLVKTSRDLIFKHSNSSGVEGMAPRWVNV